MGQRDRRACGEAVAVGHDARLGRVLRVAFVYFTFLAHMPDSVWTKTREAPRSALNGAATRLAQTRATILYCGTLARPSSSMNAVAWRYARGVSCSGNSLPRGLRRAKD